MKNEGPTAGADRSAFTALVRLAVTEHLPWKHVLVDTVVTESPSPPLSFVITAGLEPHNGAITP